MKRSGPPQRRAPLRTTTPIGRGAPIGRGTRSPAKQQRVERMDELRPQVFSRDRYRCQARARYDLLPPEARASFPLDCWTELHPHHLWLSSRGGPDELWNLLTVCLVHHDWIHAHPAWSTAVDLMRSGPPPE